MGTLPYTIRESYKLFELEGNSLEEIATKRNFSSRTIVNHLSSAIKEGLPVSMSRIGVTPEVKELIIRTVRSPVINSDITRLRRIKRQLPGEIDYNQMNIVLAILTREFGLRRDVLQSDSPSPSQLNSTQAGSNGNKRKLSPSMSTGSRENTAGPPSTPPDGKKIKKNF